jgi:hypothetical protein
VRKIVGTILMAACAQAQLPQDLLLPETRHIFGVVVDAQGEPVAKASIDHTNDRLHVHQTDSEGRFELDTRAPAVVVREAGFRSEFVRTQDASQLRIALQRPEKIQAFRTCSSTRRYVGLPAGWRAQLQFPRDRGVKASPQGHDIDYVARSYYVETKEGRKGIRHGSGPNWTDGMPLDQNVWRSVKYAETTFDAGSYTIVDARGQFPNGNLWRELIKPFESASYSEVDAETARILDRFLDGACVKPALLK